jgi:Flp pilus assembly pilin Flp
MRRQANKNGSLLVAQPGISAIEYGLLSCLMAVTMVTAATLVGPDFSRVFNAVAANLHVAVGD